MGYTTDFYGSFDLDKPLTEAHAAYLHKFSETRRMGRHADLVAELPDPIREAVGLPVGIQGEYYVGDDMTGYFVKAGFNEPPKNIIDHNTEPSTQPGLWCQWVPHEDCRSIVWDGGEKFYSYVEWLIYIIDNFLKPWGYTLNGEVQWQGENMEDRGVLVVENNRVGTRILAPTSVTWHT